MTALIEFSAQAIIHQTVNIVAEDLTPEQLVEGLNRGEYLTTIEYNNVNQETRTICKFDEEGNEVTLAEIEKQTVQDAGYTDFALREIE